METKATEIINKLEHHRSLGIKKEGYACGEDFTYYEYPSENMKMFEHFIAGEIKGLLTAYKNELEFLNSFYNNCKNEKTIFEIHDERDLLNRIQHLESEIKKLNKVVGDGE